MANRYWVGGAGDWNATTTHWSETDGGANGASSPNENDDVFFTNLSGLSAGNTINLSKSTDICRCKNFTSTTGVAYKFKYVTSDLHIYGNAIFESGITGAASDTYFYFVPTANDCTIQFNGCSLSYIIFGDTSVTTNRGGKKTLLDSLSITISGGKLELRSDTIDVGNNNITVPTVSIPSGTASRYPTILMGSGVWTITGVGTAWSRASTQAIITPQTSTIKFSNTSSSAITFAGFGKNYNTVWFDRGSSAATNTISGSNTISEFKDTGTVVHQTNFTAGTSQTITTWNANGTVGKVFKLRSTSTSNANLIKYGGGVVNLAYLDIDYITASPLNTWLTDITSIAGGHTVGFVWDELRDPKRMGVLDRTMKLY